MTREAVDRNTLRASHAIDTTVALRLSRAERDAVRRLAASHDRTVSSEVRRAIRFYLSDVNLAIRPLREPVVADPQPGTQDDD